jgi:hypothetical protein
MNKKNCLKKSPSAAPEPEQFPEQILSIFGANPEQNIKILSVSIFYI